jgi:hypothetical protein
MLPYIINVARLKKYHTPTRPIGSPTFERSEDEDAEVAEAIEKLIEAPRKILQPMKNSDPVRNDVQPIAILPESESHEIIQDENEEALVREDDHDDEPEWEVEDILKVRHRKGQHEYHVKWQGFDAPTWEPAEYLEGCQEKVHDFHRRFDLLCDACNYRALTTNGLRQHIRMNH